MTKDKFKKITEDFKNLEAAFKNFNSTMSSGLQVITLIK